MLSPSSPPPLRGVFLVAAAAISWGTIGATTTLLAQRTGAGPLPLGALRMCIGAVLLLAAARALTGALGLRRNQRGWCVAMGACMAAFQATYFVAVTLCGIAVTALVAICSAPVIVAGLAWWQLGERPTPRVLTALATGVAGTLLLAASGGLGESVAPGFARGVLLALGAGFSYALYTVLAKRSVAHDVPLRLAAWTFTTAALLSAPALVLAGGPGERILEGWPWLLYLGAVTTAAAYAAYTTGLREVSATAAGLLGLLEPLTATLLGILAFGERLGVAGTAGAALILGALALLAASPRRRPASPRG